MTDTDTSSSGASSAEPPDDEPTGFEFEDDPAKSRNSPSKLRSAIEWVVVIVGAIIVALVIKAFLIQAFYIPSGSMEPTLKIHDRVLVNKLSYKAHAVNRGDIVVFERPEGESQEEIKDLIKRVVGLPGESVVIKDNQVMIDGQHLVEPYLPDGTLINTDASPRKCTEIDPCVVPDGQVWVMGDNRTNSKDSRWFGPIPENQIVGRAFVRVWPLDNLGFL